MATNFLSLRNTLRYNPGGSTISDGSVALVSTNRESFTQTLMKSLNFSTLVGSTLSADMLSGSTLSVAALTGSTLSAQTLVGSTLQVQSVIGSTLGVQSLIGSTLTINSTTLSLGQSTNQTYTNLSNGSYAAGSWITAKTGLINPRKLGTSSTGQYQLVASDSGLWLSSDSGVTWTQLSAATTGLPTLTGGAYWSAASISASGQYILLAVYGGTLWMSQDYGRTFAITAQPTPDIWLPLNGSTADVMGSSTVTATGSPNYVTVPRSSHSVQAIQLANLPGTTGTQYVRGTWTGASSWTTSFWFNMQSYNTIAGQSVLFSAYSGALLIIMYNSSISVFSYDGNGTSAVRISSSSQPALNTWYYVSYIHQNNGTCSLYLNNTLVGSYTNVGGIGNPCVLFSLGTYDTGTSSPFNGLIADLRITNSALPYVALPHTSPNIWLPMDTPSDANATALATATTALAASTIYLPFENSVADQMGVSTVTATGAPTYVSATHWGATSQAINLANTAGSTATKYVRGTWTGAPNFTVSFWMNPQTVSSTYFQLVFSAYSGMVSIAIEASGACRLYANGQYTGFSSVLSTNTWYYVTGIFQANGVCSLYINNSLISTCTNIGGFGTTSVFELSGADSNQAYAFNGYVDDFRLYNSALTYLPLATSTIYLPLDGSVTDARGVSTVTATGSPAFVDAARLGYTGQAINLANTAGGTATKYVRGTWTGATNFTVSGWFNIQQLVGNYQLIFCAFQGTLAVAIDATTNRIYANVPTGGGSSYAACGTTTYTAAINTWYYFTLIFQTNGLCSFYINNALIGSLTNTGGLGTYTTTQFALGTYDSSTNYAFNGLIDDLRIYNDAVPYTPVPMPISVDSPSSLQNLGSATSLAANGTVNPTVALTFEGSVNNTGTSAASTGALAPTIWLPFDGSTADATGLSTITAPGTYTYVSPARPGVTGSNAINLANTAGGTAVNYVRGTLSGFSNTITISGWFNVQSTSSAPQVIFSTGSQNIVVYINGTTNTIGLNVNGSPNITTSFGVSTNTWYHFYAIIQGNGICYLYINGILIGTYSMGTSLAAITAFGVGTYDSVSLTYAFNGYIDDLRIYNSAVYYNPGGFVTGSVTYVPGTVGVNAVNLANTAGGTATNRIGMAYTPPTSFKITGCFNLQTLPSSNVSMVFGGGTSAATIYQMYITTAGLVKIDVPGSSNSMTTISTNTWYYFSLVYQTSGTCSLYLNGSLAGTFTGTALSPTPTMLYLGSYSHTNTVGAFNGYIDDLKIYNLDTYAIGSLSYVPGVVGSQALNLVNTAGGTATNYVIGGISTSGVNSVTVSAWFNAQSIPPSGASMVIGLGGLTTGNYIGINLTTTGGLNAYFLNSSTVSITIGSVPNISLNTWYHVYLIFQQSGTCYAYLNGTLMGNPVAGSALYGNNPIYDFALGRNIGNNANAFNGYIDDFRIYNAAIPYHALFPQNYRSVALSGNAQYALASAASGHVIGSATSGQTWSKQAVCVGTQGDVIQPNKTGLGAAQWEQNGVNWVATASSSASGAYFAQYAFNNYYGTIAPFSWTSNGGYNLSTGIYTGSTSTTIQGGIGAQLGEWLQIQTSAPLILQSYTYACSAFSQAPKTYYIIGSNDGSSWFPLQYVSLSVNPLISNNTTCTSYINTNTTGSITIIGGAIGSGTSISYPYTTQSWLYFRIIIRELWTSNTYGCAEFGELYLNFIRPASHPSALALSYSGQYQLVATNPAAGNIMPNQTGLATPTWSQGGVTWGATASSTLNSAGIVSYGPFNNSFANASPYSWASVAAYTSSSYTGSLSTTIQGITPSPLLGEWLQLQTSVPLVMSSYNFACATFGNIPKIYYIVGSNDGSTWYPIHYAVFGATNPFTTNYTVATTSPITINLTGTQTMTAGATGTLTTTSYSYSTQAFLYFRFCFTTVFTTATGAAVELAEIYLNFANSVSYSSNAGATWLNSATTLSNEIVALSPSGQYALSTNCVPPFARLTMDNTNVDAQGVLTPATGAGTVTYSSTIVKTGLTSAFFNNTAGASPSVYLNYTVPAVLNTPSAMTLSLWIYPTALPAVSNGSDPIAFNNSTNTSSAAQQLVILSSGIVIFNCVTNVASQNITLNTVSLNTWYHYTMTFVGGTCMIYVNGVYFASSSLGGTLALTTANANMERLIIGANLSNANAFAGYIDDVRLYTQALSADQVASLYNNPALTQSIGVSSSYLPITSSTKPTLPGATANVVDAKVSQTGQYMVAVLPTNTVPETTPLARLTLDNTAADLLSALTPTTGAGSVTYSTTIKKVGTHSAYFNQTSSALPTVYLNYTIPSVLNNPSSATMACWVYPTSILGREWAVTLGTTIANGVNIGIESDGTALLFTCTTAGVGSFTNTTMQVPLTTWTHLALSFSGGMSRFYVNGVLAGTTFIGGNLSTDVSSSYGPLTNLFVGASYPTNARAFAGYVDDVRLYTTALSAAEVTALYAAYPTVNNVYYSTDSGNSFTGLSLGTSPMTACSMSYDGSYLTATNQAGTVYTLNKNANTYTLALGNQAGQINQASNAIAIGNQAGLRNQTANSIILNASGAAVNATAPGFYVSPVATTAGLPMNLLGYGADSQVVQTGVTVLPGGPYGAGYVGIGTTNPSSLLHANGVITVAHIIGGICFRQDTGYGLASSAIYANASAAGGFAALRFTGDADSLTTRPFQFGYHTNNNVANAWNSRFSIDSYYGTIYPNVDATATCGTSSNRWTAVYAVNGTIQTSDSSVKDAQPLPYGLAEINQMRTIKYKWKSQADLPDTDPSKHFEYYGFCADELAPLFPELVYDEKKDEPIQMNYAEILPVVVNAVKELSSAHQTLLAEHKETKAQLAAILSWATQQGFQFPVITDPVVTDPVVTEPVVTEPVVTDPVVTDPVVTDPTVTDPVVTEP